MKVIQILLIMTFSIMISHACSNGNTTNDKSGKEYTSAYICPMHCTGSGSDKMGKCPVCKMNYVANKEHETHAAPPLHQGGHNHQHDHGHDHSGHGHEGHSH